MAVAVAVAVAVEVEVEVRVGGGAGLPSLHEQLPRLLLAQRSGDARHSMSHLDHLLVQSLGDLISRHLVLYLHRQRRRRLRLRRCCRRGCRGACCARLGGRAQVAPVPRLVALVT